MPGLLLARSGITTASEIEVVGPAVGLIVQGAMRTVLGDHVFRYGAGQYALKPVELPVTCAITTATEREPYLAAVLRLDPAKITELLLSTNPPRSSVPTESRGIAVSTAGPGLLDAFTRLVDLLDQPGDIPVLAPLYEREILWRLLTGNQGGLVRQLGLADSRLSHIARAIGWIRAHYDEPLRIHELATLASMSPRSFHRHFRDVTRLTPVQYQKRIRLQEARALLFAMPDDVAGAGYAVGYDDPSQFSREYRRMFGAPPGQDIARLRALEITGR